MRSEHHLENSISIKIHTAGMDFREFSMWDGTSSNLLKIHTAGMDFNRIGRHHLFFDETRIIEPVFEENTGGVILSVIPSTQYHDVSASIPATTTTEPEVTTSDPVQATTTEPAEPSEPEPAQSELQQTGTEPEAAEQSVPGEPEQLAEPEQPAEPELTPEPEQTAAPPPTPSKQPPQRRTAPPSSSLAPPPKPRAGSPPKKLPDSIPPKTPAQAPRLSRAFTAAAGCWFNRCSQDASASGIRAFQNPTCSPCRVLRLTCSPGHRHEHYCHASSSGSGSGFRASQKPTCSPGHRHEHYCHASSSGSGSGFRASQNPTCSPGHRHEHDCKASSSGSGSSFRASQNAPHRHEFHVISPSHNFESSSASVVVEHRPPAPQSEVFHDRSMLELTDYYGEQFPKVFQACEREYLALSEDERKTYDWSIQCHKFRTNTCYREIPAHWDCLFKFTGNA
ncbi:hypothetical protein PAPYR_12753 [Paratrimastix pyriformis]|uniref:Uncharacterized protein n=1 Tax=Paratrimastix pyriformis TaxID=342808 RepID=A0ABQ8U1B6_9EUKA|nr:hypothetical protein PAPYR_12753 [Paratrimastix pyriformis]